MTTYDKIEEVKVNGMTMYKVEDRLFLSRNSAKAAIIRGEFNEKTLYGFKDWDDYDPIQSILKDGIIHGIKL